jgi:hypothetical protein
MEFNNTGGRRLNKREMRLARRAGRALARTGVTEFTDHLRSQKASRDLAVNDLEVPGIKPTATDRMVVVGEGQLDNLQRGLGLIRQTGAVKEMIGQLDEARIHQSENGAQTEASVV